MCSEYNHGKDNIYVFQDVDGILKSFTTEQLTEIDIPVQAINANSFQNSFEQNIETNGAKVVQPNPSNNVSVDNTQLIGSSGQNILMAQSLTNLIPINQNVRLYTINGSSATKGCKPILFNKRFVSVPSQKGPILSKPPPSRIEAGKTSFKNGLVKLMSSESIREDQYSNVTASLPFQTKRKLILDSKPDSILNVDNPKPSKSSNVSFQLLRAHNGQDIFKKNKDIVGNGKKNIQSGCKELPKRQMLQKKEPHTKIHLLQNGTEYQSVEQLDDDKLRLVTGALNRVANRRPPKNTVIYDPTSKTKIIYRVVYPEDLNLCTDQSTAVQCSKVAIKRGPSLLPKEIASTSTTPKIMSITRSGRAVKLPRHIDDDSYEPLPPQSLPKPTTILPKNPISLPMESTGQAVSNGHLDPTPKTKRKYGSNLSRHSCTKCLKIFRGYKRFAQHYVEFPDHKTTSEIKNESKSSQTSLLIKSAPKLCLSTRDASNGQVLCDPPNVGLKSKSLFDCLTNMLESVEASKRAELLVQELDVLVTKLRGLVPCILKSNTDTVTTQCEVNDTVGRLLGITPGMHIFDMATFNCTNASDSCEHLRTNIAECTTPNSVWFPKDFGSANETQKECARTNSFDKWLSEVGKNRDLISPQKLQNDQTKVCWSTLPDAGNLPVTFTAPVSNDGMLTDTISEKIAILDKNTFNETWMQDRSMKHTTMTNEIQHVDNMVSHVTSNISFLNNLDQQFIYATSNMNIPMDIDVKTELNTAGKNDMSEKFSFQNSAFNIQNGGLTNGSFDKMNLDRRSLPSFIKISGHGGLHLPSASLDDIVTSQINITIATTGSLMANSVSNGIDSSNNSLQEISTNEVLESISSPKLHLGSLNSNFHLSNMNGSHHLDRVARDSGCNTVSLETNDNACDERPLLDISETPLERSETLLSINDTSLDSTRLNLSGNQSVLQLLDPLGTDCLSFSDSELRPTSQMSLDLPLDLFPFHHA